MPPQPLFHPMGGMPPQPQPLGAPVMPYGQQMGQAMPSTTMAPMGGAVPGMMQPGMHLMQPALQPGMPPIQPQPGFPMQQPGQIQYHYAPGMQPGPGQPMPPQMMMGQPGQPGMMQPGQPMLMQPGQPAPEGIPGGMPPQQPPGAQHEEL